MLCNRAGVARSFWHDPGTGAVSASAAPAPARPESERQRRVSYDQTDIVVPRRRVCASTDRVHIVFAPRVRGSQLETAEL